jgi:hypothetical protein
MNKHADRTQQADVRVYHLEQEIRGGLYLHLPDKVDQMDSNGWAGLMQRWACSVQPEQR